MLKGDVPVVEFQVLESESRSVNGADDESDRFDSFQQKMVADRQRLVRDLAEGKPCKEN